MTESKILLETGTNELEIVEFIIKMKSGKEQSFGINVAKVREIITMPEYDEVPNANTAIKGMFHLREKVIPLVDLANYLNQNTEYDQKDCKVITTEFNKQNFGFMIHKVKTIHRLSWEKVLPPSDVLADIDKNCVIAMVPMGEHTLFMLDFEKIVADLNPASAMNMNGVEAEVMDKVDKPYKVLIADDSDVIRSMIEDTMTRAGFTLDVVKNGKEALEKLLSAKNDAIEQDQDIRDYYDLVITDIEMPQMDGHTLCKTIKEDTTMYKIPVILFSSLIYDELRKKGDRIGADAQITKPELKQVVSLAKKLIAKSKAL